MPLRAHAIVSGLSELEDVPTEKMPILFADLQNEYSFPGHNHNFLNNVGLGFTYQQHALRNTDTLDDMEDVVR